MRIKAFCGVSVYTFHAGISARQRARESVARRKMLQSSTVLNFHALRQRTQAIQPIIYRCHELSLQRIDLAITPENSHVTISSWRRSRRVRSKCSRDPAGQTDVFVPVSLLLTFNLIYSYRQLAVRIDVSAIAVFSLVDDVIGTYL